MRVEPAILHKDDLRFIAWEDRVQVYSKVDELLAELFWPGDGRDTCVLLENHLSIIDQVGVRTFPHEDVRRYNPVGLVVVEASPEDVLQRRLTDDKRNRHIGSLMEVAEQQRINRREAGLVGKLIDIPIATVANDDRERAARQLADWVTAALG